MAGLAGYGGFELNGKFKADGTPDYGYNTKLVKGPREQWQSLTNTYGGAGNFGVVSDGEGGYISVDKAAFDAVPTGYDKMTMKDYQAANPSTGWFGKDGYLANGAAVAGALGGLASAYTGYKNYQLAKDQFDAEQKYAGANLYNQGTLVNNQIKNAAEVGQSLAGDTMTADQRAAGLAGLASKYVKTAV